MKTLLNRLSDTAFLFVYFYAGIKQKTAFVFSIFNLKESSGNIQSIPIVAYSQADLVYSRPTI